MTTISVSSTIGITLIPPLDTNPVVIEAGVTISSSIGTAVLANYGTAGSFIIQNDGSISAPDSTAGIGIDLTPGGSVTNAASGVIAGAVDGVYVSGGGGTVNNSGSIVGSLHNGVYLIGGGGSVINAASGSISGNHGVDIAGTAGTPWSIMPAEIFADSEGVACSVLADPVTNAASGFVYGYTRTAVYIGGSVGTVS